MTDAALQAAPGDPTWRCGHVKSPENTHGGTERTHAQCRCCRRASQRAADKRYRDTFNGWAKHLRAQRARRWRNGAYAGLDSGAANGKIARLARAEGKALPDWRSRLAGLVERVAGVRQRVRPGAP